MTPDTLGEIRPTAPVIRPPETPDQAFTRLSIWSAGAADLIGFAADFPHLPDARNPDRLRTIAATLADVAAELVRMAEAPDTTEERGNG